VIDHAAQLRLNPAQVFDPDQSSRYLPRILTKVEELSLDRIFIVKLIDNALEAD
jgi:hypothetical protein